MIPKWQQLTLPILKICKDGGKFHKKQLASILAEQFELTEEERNREKPSGGEKLLENRVSWAAYFLKKAGLTNVERNVTSITDDGKEVLKHPPESMNRKYLLTIPKFQEYLSTVKVEKKEPEQEKIDQDSEQSPEDMIISGYESIRENIENDLLEKISENTPEFFESLILELIRKMGYGINHKVLGRTGDGGIDGVITEDKLEFDEIYFQAKRWKGTVPIAQVRDFAGALMAKKSKKGIFITTSDFSDDAY